MAVSVLLKTSRGLKRHATKYASPQTSGFSALEDEPWIEAAQIASRTVEIVDVSVLLKTSRGLKHGEHHDITESISRFSALEDEPWIEAQSR